MLLWVAACARVPELELVEGVRRPGELADGQAQTFRLRSPQERAVELVVEQHGVDVALTVRDADGAPWADVDGSDETAVGERLLLIVEPGVDYRFEVRDTLGAGGSYEVRVERVRPPTAADRRLAAAGRAFALAETKLPGTGREPSPRRAASLYREAAAAFGALGDVRRQAETEQRLGRLYRKFLEDKRVALEHYEAALALYRSLGDEHAESVVLNSAGWLLFDLGENDQAVVRWQRALAIKRRSGDAVGEAATLANLAQAARYRGEARSALALYQDSIELLDRDPAVLEHEPEAALYLGGALNNRGKLYQALGALDQALADLERALATCRWVAERPRFPASTRRAALEVQAIALNGIGGIRRQRNELDEAVADLEQALELRKRLGTKRGRAVTLLALSRVYADLDRRREALAGFEQALELFRELESPRSEAQALVAISNAVEGAGGPDRAARLAAEALERFVSLGDRAGEIEARLALARAEHGLGRQEAALASAERALATAESLRLEAPSPELRASFFAASREQADLYVDLLMERHWRERGAGFDRQALEASERFRARSLLDLLRRSRDAARDRADPELFAGKQELEARIRLLIEEREELAGDRLEAVESRLDELLREHRALDLEIGRSVPPTAAPRAFPTLDATAIQALLEPGTALLEYHLGARRSHLWVVTAESLSVFELAPRREIERAARELHKALRSSHRVQYQVATELAQAALAERVLDPAASALGAERLLVAADGALHYVPFAALPLPDRGAGPVSPAAPRDLLVDRHEVAMVPSASTLAALRAELAGRPRPPRSVAVIGDPVFDAADPRLPASAREDGAGPGDPVSASVSGDPGDPAGRAPRRLEFAGEEARAVLSLAPPELRLEALGLDATRELATAPELGGYGILHFATHAYVDTRRPELSRLVFSRVDAAGRPRDGSLYAFELHRLDLAADLVVLSGCETALGREVRGEGLVGLTQGFFDAGAAQVLVSLWPVDDRATAELMSRFYRGLLAGEQSPEAALRAAQRSMRRVESWRAPYFWAGFVLQGERRGER